MTLFDALKPYRTDQYRLVGLHPNEGAGRRADNHLLFSMTYLSLLCDTGTVQEAAEECQWMSRLLPLMQIAPGLLVRYPGDTDLQAHDDYIGALGFDQRFAENVYQYGVQNHYCWNSEEPGKWCWRGFFLRFPDFWPTVKAAAGRKLTLLNKAMFCLGLLGTLFEPAHETSGKCLMYLKCRIIYGRSRLLNWAIRCWVKYMLTQYTGLHGLYLVYFGPTHPLTVYAPEHFPGLGGK